MLSGGTADTLLHVRLLVEDSWHESPGTVPRYVMLTGRPIFSLDVSLHAAAGQPFESIVITNFDGLATIFNNRIDQRTVLSGSGTGSVYYVQSISLNDQSTTTKDVYTNFTGNTTGVFENCRWETTGYPTLANVNAPAGTNFVRDLFQFYRSMSPNYTLDIKTNGVTDVRLHNVGVTWGKSGIEVKP